MEVEDIPEALQQMARYVFHMLYYRSIRPFVLPDVEERGFSRPELIEEPACSAQESERSLEYTSETLPMSIRSDDSTCSSDSSSHFARASHRYPGSSSVDHRSSFRQYKTMKRVEHRPRGKYYASCSGSMKYQERRKRNRSTSSSDSRNGKRFYGSMKRSPKHCRCCKHHPSKTLVSSYGGHRTRNEEPPSHQLRKVADLREKINSMRDKKRRKKTRRLYTCLHSRDASTSTEDNRDREQGMPCRNPDRQYKHPRSRYNEEYHEFSMSLESSPTYCRRDSAKRRSRRLRDPSGSNEELSGPLDGSTRGNRMLSKSLLPQVVLCRMLTRAMKMKHRRG